MNIKKVLPLFLILFAAIGLFLVQSNTFSNTKAVTNDPEPSAQAPTNTSVEAKSQVNQTTDTLASADAKEEEPRIASVKYYAYYMHGSARCVTCVNIETYTKEAIQSHFAKEIENGLLVWESLDVQQPEYSHYIQDFQLTAQSVILIREKDGKMESWKNLQRVWQLVGNKEAFQNYIVSETSAFLKEE